MDGAFAQYVKVPQTEVFTVHCDWTDAELALIPCAYGTTENMVHRAGVTAGSSGYDGKPKPHFWPSSTNNLISFKCK